MLDLGYRSRGLAAAICLSLGGCAQNCTAPAEIVAEPAPLASCPAPETAAARTPEFERRLRSCLDDKRRLEHALQESQKRAGELQRKLDALLAIDRDLRNREKGR